MILSILIAILIIFLIFICAGSLVIVSISIYTILIRKKLERFEGDIKSVLEVMALFSVVAYISLHLIFILVSL